MIDQLITQIANTMNVSEAYVATAIDTLINPPQPYVPLQDLCTGRKRGQQMTHEEALDIFKCFAWHDLRPSEEKIEMAFKVLGKFP